MPHSADPHLGLALIQMNDGELDKAEEELNQAQRNGFRPGRREQKALADGYRRRGERLIAAAKRVHDIGQMEDDLKHADSDLAHAQSLYNSIAPFLHGVELAEKVSLERDNASKTLADARQARNPAAAPAQENP